MDKKGAEKILAVYWFTILILVAGGIFAMVYTFYHYPYDVREMEANIMINNLADCLSKNGKIESYVIFQDGTFNEPFKIDFLNQCHFNFDNGERYERDQYYLQADFYKFEDLENPLASISGGNQNWIADCKLEKDEENYEKTAQCLERRFYSLGQNGNQYLIKILAIVGKTKENVK